MKNSAKTVKSQKKVALKDLQARKEIKGGVKRGPLRAEVSENISPVQCTG